MTQKSPLMRVSRVASGGVAPSSQIAPVDSPAPANGIAEASALLRRVDEASDEKLVDEQRIDAP